MSHPLTVVDCQSYILDIPLIRPHVMSWGAPKEVNYVVFRLETEDGTVGWGESATFQGPTWSDECAETIDIIIKKYIAPQLIGKNIIDFEVVLEKAFARVQGHNFAKATVEFAVLDVIGKHYGQSISRLFAGRYRESVPLSWSLASGDLDRDLAEAQKKFDEGYRIFKLKAGSDSWQEDVARVKAVREQFGDSVSIRVDVNQGWNEATSCRAIREMEPYNLDFVEQPVPKWNLQGLADIRRQATVPIMADESLTGEHGAMDLIRSNAADIFAYKLVKFGGFLKTRQAYFMARAAGLSAYIGCMIETSLGTAAYLQFAATLPELTFGCELWGPQMITGDIVENSLLPVDGQVYIPDGPGLGVTVNDDKVREYLRK